MSWWKKILSGAATGAVESSLGTGNKPPVFTNSTLDEKSLVELYAIRRRLLSELKEVNLQIDSME